MMAAAFISKPSIPEPCGQTFPSFSLVELLWERWKAELTRYIPDLDFRVYP